jgi:hypothetical protein
LPFGLFYSLDINFETVNNLYFYKDSIPLSQILKLSKGIEFIRPLSFKVLSEGISKTMFQKLYLYIYQRANKGY